MPTLNELFRPFRAGPDATAANPLLEPERLSGAEAGVRFSRGGAQVELTGFVNRLSDAIANVTIGHGPGQLVKMKLATQMCPSREWLSNGCPFCAVSSNWGI